MRRRLALALLVVAIAILWRPLIRPVGSGAILVADIYSSALWDRNVAAYMTPLPVVTGTRETFAGMEMRVTWWRPSWGDRHPALMMVNGATALGNDDPETTRLAEALARAGYLVMLPEFPFIREGTLEPRATARSLSRSSGRTMVGPKPTHRSRSVPKRDRSGARSGRTTTTWLWLAFAGCRRR